MARTQLALFLVAFGTLAGGCGGDNCKEEEKIEAWADEDGDGYGAGEALKVCAVDKGQASNADDCDDANADLHPDAEELCNGLDDDCNDTVDNGLELVLFYRDTDLDGYGNTDSVALMCDAPDDTWSRSGADCDDDSADRNPGEVEVCDTVDNDCDQLVDDDDETVDPNTFTQWYRDADGDGYGRPGPSNAACAEPPDSADNDQDCDDVRADVNPGAQEVCDQGTDNDCDTYRDDLDDSLDTAGQVEFFADTDGDGFGEPGSSVYACNPVPGIASQNDADCDDGNVDVSPAENELPCDTIDNDCDALTPDDDDRDEDGFFYCADADCDDLDPETYPGAPEIPSDATDQDCDTFELCYQDLDMDGSRGDVLVQSEMAIDPTCTTAPNVPAIRPLDCDDNNDTVTWSGRWESDTDLDGFGDGVVALTDCLDPGAGYVLQEDGETDCDDTAGTTFPGNPVDECNDGVDADCNTLDSCATCGEWLSTDPLLASGAYALRPLGGDNEIDVYCDMTTDGGGWTLVGSSTLPMNDVGGAYHTELSTLTPADPHPAVFAGLGDLITGDSDLRFACKLAPADEAFAVDLSFYGVDWYSEIAAADLDAQSCFSDGAAPDATPTRRDNLTGITKDGTDAYDDGAFVGEDACNDAQDFTVDFDDAGMNSNESDGTDWGEDDNVPKCGVANSGGAWFLFVREL